MCDYIESQKEHHKNETYDDEYEGYVKFYQQTIRKKVNKQWCNEVIYMWDNLFVLLWLFC